MTTFKVRQKMNKEEEKYYLDQFLANFPILRLSKIQDHESPDFLCESDGKTIGFELTRFFQKKNGSMKSQIRHSNPNSIEYFSLVCLALKPTN